MPPPTASLLFTLATALPFVFGITTPPTANVWPLLASAACAWLMAALAWAGHAPPTPAGPAQPGWLANALVLAALLGGSIGLLQYFQGDPGLAPWVRPSSIGQAIGNLRQRNQQATLIALGLWALLWWLARLQQQALQAEPGASRAASAWRPLLLVSLAPAALALLAAAGAATVSRTGALQWLLVLALLLCWWRSSGLLALAAALLGLAMLALASWQLPLLLHELTGLPVESLWARVTDSQAGRSCTSRGVLWGNVLQLIAQRPWAGWGWGELDWAHYITPLPGERFCLLLDNAHNLPLHLAVELGLPVALLACAGTLWLLLRARPWRESQPQRQLAWGVLALVGLHSLLEFPLWYGPFQLISLLALLVLLQPWLTRHWQALGRPLQRALHALAGLGLLLALLLAARLVQDYRAVSVLYRPYEDRPAALRSLDALELAQQLWFFRPAAEFAWLTTTPVTPEQAAPMHAMALRLLHYSPEPRVIEKLIASAQLLGLQDEAALHRDRLRRAWPSEYAAWLRRQAAAGPPTNPPASEPASAAPTATPERKTPAPG